MNDQELDEIIRILGEIEDVLNDLTHEPTSVVPPGLWQNLRDAITELGSTKVTSPPPVADNEPALTRVRISLERLKEEVGAEWVGAIENPGDMRAGLDQHGFSGSQLRLQASAIDTAYANYVSLGRIGEIPKNDQGWLRKTGRRIRKFLAPSATFLDSLANVPGLNFLGFVSEAVSTTDQAINIADPG